MTMSSTENIIEGMCYLNDEDGTVCQRQSGMVCGRWKTEQINYFERVGGCPNNTISFKKAEGAKKKVNPLKASKRASR
jgi:hypothetical protein